MDIKEAMAKALELEQKGMEYYTEVANKTQNKMVKDVFSYVANQEKFHEAEIRKYIASSEVELKGDEAPAMKTFFGNEIEGFKEHMAATDEDTQAYEKAMQLEKDAFNFYKEEHDTTDNEDVKKFMQFLMEQENGHYELFRNAMEYLKDPEGYHMDQEDWNFEG